MPLAPSNISPRGPRIGFLGGGQLAWMLAGACARVGAHPRVLAAHDDEPAVRAGVDASIGDLRDPEVLASFFATVDVVTIESELVPVAALEEALRRQPRPLWPGYGAIATSQNKLRQKELFATLGLPTAPWMVCVPGDEPALWLREVRLRFGDAFVLKWAEGGYDGRGVVLGTSEEAEEPGDAAAFVAAALARGSEVYAEARVAYAHELALVCSRSATGDMEFYPLVVSEQRQGVCWRVRGPATAMGVPGAVEAAARTMASAIGAHLDARGTFALELFQLPAGELLINEMAPRVHNSGHYTLDACAGSQFENHVRAVLEEALVPPAPRGRFAMVNLLGPEGYEGSVPEPQLDTGPGTNVYWYGKTRSMPRRKLGHVNIVADSEAALAHSLVRVEAAIARWSEGLRGSGETDMVKGR